MISFRRIFVLFNIYKSTLAQSTSMLSITNDELYICKMISKNTKKRAINKAIIDVVPQPGATFPYSELKGRKTPPKRVLNAINYFVRI